MTEYADWQNLSMPSITGYLAPTLTVTNLARSVSWYREVLELTIRREYEPPDKRQRDACLVEPHTGLEICLVEYSGGAQDAFNEVIPGLGHLEFLVAERTIWTSGLSVSFLGNRPFWCQGASVYTERDAHIPRPGQHPARVLLEVTNPVTVPPSRCLGIGRG